MLSIAVEDASGDGIVGIGFLACVVEHLPVVLAQGESIALHGHHQRDAVRTYFILVERRLDACACLVDDAREFVNATRIFVRSEIHLPITNGRESEAEDSQKSSTSCFHCVRIFSETCLMVQRY